MSCLGTLLETGSGMDHFDPLGVGLAHGQDLDGDVGIVRTPGGGLVLMPVSVRRLRGDALEAASDIQALAAEISRLQGRLADGVENGRQVGLSWGVIGWSVGTTGEAARQRWGDAA